MLSGLCWLVVANMVKTPSKRSASTAALDGTPVQERVVKLDPGLQSLMDYGDNIEVTISFVVVPFEIPVSVEWVFTRNRSVAVDDRRERV